MTGFSCFRIQRADKERQTQRRNAMDASQTTLLTVSGLVTAPTLFSIMRTACSPMALLRSVLNAFDILTGFSPGRSHALCGRGPSGCPTLNAPCERG